MNDKGNGRAEASSSNPPAAANKDQSTDGKNEKKARKRIRKRRGQESNKVENQSVDNNAPVNAEGQPRSVRTKSQEMCDRTKNVDIKIKINRLKGKLAKFSNNCIEVNRRLDSRVLVEERSEMKDRQRKPRSCSERTPPHLDVTADRTYVRSMSFSTSSNIGQPSKNSKEEIGDPINLAKVSKKRQRDRRRSIKKTLWGYFNEQSPQDDPKEFVLDSLSFFLLDLLITPPDKREYMIAMEACKRGILLSDHDCWMLNPKLLKWTGAPFKGAYEEITKLYSDQPLAGKCFISSPVEEPKVSFEDFVNSVVQEGLPEEQRKTFSLPVTSKEKRKINYFKEQEFENNLEAFAQKCVEANLGVIVEGDVRISAKNNEHGFIHVPESERDAMLPTQLLRKFALQGDVVRAFVRNKLEAEEERRDEQKSEIKTEGEPLALDDSVDILPEEPLVFGKSCKAFVIKIVREVNNRLVVGNFLSYRKNTKYITFVPRDMRMPNIRIYQKDWPESFRQGKMDDVGDILYVAEITSWENEICIGKIKQPIGKCGELDSENRAILLKHNLRFEPFDDKFNEQYSGEFIISEEELKRREDLRQECIFTIDPLTAKDLDDAMSIKELPDGNFEIGVHISDVAFFVDEDSELDQLVKKRTTSVYMVNEVFHMLPKSLCFRCSLLPGEDKLGFSVFWTMSPNADILTTRFTRSIIRSCTQFAYQHAQMIIDNPEREFVDADFPQIHNGFAATDIVRRVKQLNSLADIMRAKRFDNGALKIDKPKMYFDLDPKTGAPIAYHRQEQLAANFLIEEFMLLANQSVAKYIYENFPNISILRNHQPPLKNVLKRVKDQLLKAGLVLDVSNSKSIQNSLLRLISESQNPDSASICLSQLVSKPMTRAKYFCTHDLDYEYFKHYALSIPIYTHFTSPIRRYPDVLVHRILAAALDYAQIPKRTPAELKTLAEHCNDDKYNAKLAGEDSVNLYFLHYVQSKGHVIMQAVVVEIYSFSCEVILVETGTLLSISWKNSAKVKVSVSKDNGVCKATITYTSLDKKEVNLKLCSEIWLKVTAKSNRLKGEIVPPPAKDNSLHLNDELDTETIATNNPPTEEVDENCDESDAESESSNNELSDEAIMAAEESDDEQSDDDTTPHPEIAEKNNPDSVAHPLGTTNFITDSPNLGIPQSLKLSRLLSLHSSQPDETSDASSVNKSEQSGKRMDDTQPVPDVKTDVSFELKIEDIDPDIVIEAEEVVTLSADNNGSSKLLDIVKSIEKLSIGPEQSTEQDSKSKTSVVALDLSSTREATASAEIQEQSANVAEIEAVTVKSS